MTRPSKSQLERLGYRLVDAPTSEDFDALHALLSDYSSVLERAVDRVRSELDLTPTSRVKNTITIREKLQRQGGSWLKSMHDLVGMRIVRSMTRGEQDALVARIADLFADASRQPVIVDRRVNPAAGYRAVHVIVFPEAVPIEIQVRTRWQHEWAELFEKLADRVGRDIRYGAKPQRMMDLGAVLLLETLSYLIDGAETMPGSVRSDEIASLLAQYRQIIDQYPPLKD